MRTLSLGAGTRAALTVAVLVLAGAVQARGECIQGLPNSEWIAKACESVTTFNGLRPALMGPKLDTEAEKTKQKFEAMGFVCDPRPGGQPQPGLVCKCDPKVRAKKPTEEDMKKAMQCQQNFGGYPEPVAIVVPPNYHKTVRPEFVVHFHGNSPPPTIDDVISHYGLAQGLADSQRNAIMIVPYSPSSSQAKGVAKSFFFAEASRFKGFIDGASNVVNSADLLNERTKSVEPGSIMLTSHSGGGFPLGEVLRAGGYRSKIKEVALFDSTYTYDGNPDPRTDPPKVVEAWAREPGNRLWSTYTNHNSGKGKNADLIAAIDKPAGHCSKGSWKDDPTYPSSCEVSTKSCGFVDLGPDTNHDPHVKKLYGRMLAPSFRPLTNDELRFGY